MKASEFITKLKALVEKHGDHDIFSPVPSECGEYWIFSDLTIYFLETYSKKWFSVEEEKECQNSENAQS